MSVRIFVGDVRNVSSLEAAFEGSDVAIIVTSSAPIPDGKGGYFYENGRFCLFASKCQLGIDEGDTYAYTNHVM